MGEVTAIHPLEAYLGMSKGAAALTDEQAKDCMAGLVNDPRLLQEVCAMFSDRINSGNRCFVVGKVYDIDSGRYGCVTILSEDVAGVIGDDYLQRTHEDMNYALMCAFTEFRRFCAEVSVSYDAWDDFLRFAVQERFLPLFKNGVRARLVCPAQVDGAIMPILVFIVYLEYGEMYG